MIQEETLKDLLSQWHLKSSWGVRSWELSSELFYRMTKTEKCDEVQFRRLDRYAPGQRRKQPAYLQAFVAASSPLSGF